MTFPKSPERPQEYHNPVEFNKEYNALRASLNKRRSEQGVAQARQDLMNLIEKYGEIFSGEQKKIQYEKLDRLVNEKLQKLNFRQEKKTNIQGEETEKAEQAEVEVKEEERSKKRDGQEDIKITEPPKQEEMPEKKEEREPDAEARLNFADAYLPQGIEKVRKRIEQLKTVKENSGENDFTTQVKDFLIDSLVKKRTDAAISLEESLSEIADQKNQDYARELVKNLPKTKKEFEKIKKNLPPRDRQAWHAFENYYGTIMKELIFIDGLKKLNFDFANLQADYNLSEIKPFLELFRAENLTAENAKLAESEQPERKSFNLFKQRALELLKKELGIHLPAFNNANVNTEMDTIREKRIKNIENLKYSPENKQSLMDRMKEYFNELIGKADSLIKTEFGEIKIQNTEEMVEFLRRQEITPYCQSHDFQIKKIDPEDSILLPVNPSDYTDEKLTVGEGLPDLPEPSNSKMPGHWLIKNPQLGYEIQDKWRRYGSPSGIKYNAREEQDQNGKKEIKIEIEKVYFHTAEEKEYFLEQLRGRQESPEEREARKSRRQIYREKIFDYLKGDEDEAQNDEAQKEMRRLIKEFGRSRGWNKEHLARAYSEKLDIDPPLTGEEFMDGFIKRKGYAYYSEDIINKKTKGLSLEGVMFIESLANLSLPPEQKKTLAIYFSRNNHLKKPQEDIENFQNINRKWQTAVANLDQTQLKEILMCFSNVRENLVDIGLVMKSFDAQGKVGYKMTNENDVVLILYQDSDGNYTAIRRRLLKDKISYNYYDYEDGCWKKYTEEINGGLEPGGNKYLSDPRVYSDFEPRELEGTTYNAALLIPKIWKNEADWIAAGGLKEQWNPNEAKAIIVGRDIVITEGEFKSAITSELTGIPHIAIPGITMVEPELIQKAAEAKPKSVTIVFDADPDGMAHLRGDLLTDSERAAFRIAKMLEAAGVAVKVAIWPEEYRRRRITTGIKDTEDLFVRQTDGIEIYQNEILAKAVSCEDYVKQVNTKARQEDLRYTKMEKLNETMEKVLALEHDLRIVLEKFKTAKDRGAVSAPEELKKKIKDLEDTDGLLWSLKKESSHFYLGTDLDKPAEHVMSFSPDIVPESEDKSFITEKRERIPADKADGNIINYRFFPADILEIEEKLNLQNREQFYFIDPVDEKQTIVQATWAELDHALDFGSKLGDNDQDKKYRQIRADVLNGLSAVEGLDWKKVITEEKAQYLWKQRCLEHDIDEADLLLTVYSKDFDKQAQRIVSECFANKEETNQLTDVIGRLDDYLADKLAQKEFAEKATFYVIGNYLIDKFSDDDVRYELGVEMLENESGVLVKRGRINISGWDAKKASGILKFTADVLAVEPDGRERATDYQTTFSKMQIEFRNLINTLRGSYAEQRREFRGALEWCKRFAEKNQKVIFAGEQLNRKDYLKELIQTTFNIKPDQVDAVIEDLGLMVLFPDDFNKILSSEIQNLQGEEEAVEEPTEETQKTTKTALAKSGLFALMPNGKPSPKFMGPVLVMGKSPSYDQAGNKAPDVGADVLPLSNLEFEKNPALLLEKADGRPMFPIQGQGNESQRAAKEYFAAGHHLSRLKDDGVVVVCFGLPELINEQREQISQNIKPEKQAVIGIDYSLELLFANIKKVLNKNPKEIKIVIDNLDLACARSLLNQETRPGLGILRDLSLLTELVPKDITLKLKTKDEKKSLSDWLESNGIDISEKTGRDKVRNIKILKEYLTQFAAWLNLPVKPPEYINKYMQEKNLKNLSLIDQNKLKQDAGYKELPASERNQIDELITWVKAIPGKSQNITGDPNGYKEFVAKLLNRSPEQIVNLSALAQEKFTARNYSLLPPKAQESLNKIPGIISNEDSKTIRGFESWKDGKIAKSYIDPQSAAEKIREALGCA